uniref:Galectin n=1 Tax=Cyprinus carpio TaxID=7962 RepID=A0A8C1YFX4_CYPCA
QFQHRIPLDRVIALSVGGEVSLTNVVFTEVSDPPLLQIFSDYINCIYDDTAFHFNPRLHQKVVMNSFRNRKWEAKESVSDNPFKKGETFEMKLGACPHTGCVALVYQVYVNGKELYTFKHRIPLEKVTSSLTQVHLCTTVH